MTTTPTTTSTAAQAQRRSTAAWQKVRTFDELAKTMVRFLQGELHESADHGAPLDPESSAITDDLVALTRRGLVTHNSQPGRIEPTLRQRAWVSLLTRDVEIAHDLVLALGHTELIVMSAPQGEDVLLSLPVTWWDGTFGTWAGRLGEGERSFWYSSLGRQAYDAVGTMCFVQVLDPQWGRERYLWDQLHTACDLLQLPRLAAPRDPAARSAQP